MTPTQFTLTPFWLGYAVALLVILRAAWKLSREGHQRNKDTDAREGQR